MNKPIIFSFVLIIALSLFYISVLKIINNIKSGKPEKRNDKKFSRILNVIKYSIFQLKIFRFKFSGVLHYLIFWGFLILLLSIIENIIEGYYPDVSLNFRGVYYSILTTIQDVFGVLVLASAFILLLRRFFFTPKRLQNNYSKIDAPLILMMIILIMITMFGTNIQKILLNNSFGYRPISLYISNFFNSTSQITYEFFWWTHILLILAFLNYLPHSKHLHILTSIPNVYFSNYNIKNNFSIKPINFENELSEYYGAKDVDDLSWKQLLDSYSCTHCGRCTISCPANQTGKVLDPKNLILNIRNRLESISKLKSFKHTNLIEDFITKEEIWDCTSCFACTHECPVMIDHLTNIIDIRRYLVLTESDFPLELNTTFRNLEKYFSPFQIKADDRNYWIRELLNEPDFKKDNLIFLNDKPKNHDYEILFWVGCMGAIDMQTIEVTKSFAKLLAIAGVKFGVLGSEEKCNGDLARRLGNEYLAQELIKTNIDTFKKYHVNKIVTICPHCYNVFKNEYSYFGIELEVYHHTEYIYRFFKEKKLNIIDNKELNITYHDPCYLSRYNNIYKKPRNILKLLFNFQEVKRTKDRSFCCGAGGGRMFIEEKKGKRINIERLNTLIKENTNAIATSCPFCLSMLIEATKSTKKEINIKDISEIILEHFKLN